MKTLTLTDQTIAVIEQSLSKDKEARNSADTVQKFIIELIEKAQKEIYEQCQKN